jgi:hypothetical protein
MKITKTLGVTLVAVLALGALSASAAGAYEWQIGGRAIVSPAAVSWTSTIKFENNREGYAFSCTIAHKGTVGAGAKGEITSITSSGGAKAIPCTLTRSSSDCESAMEIEAQGLPWSTELAAVGDEARNKITGSHEWKVRCKGILGAITNSCGVSPSLGSHNITTGVEQINDVNSPSTACSLDGGDPFITRGSESLSSTFETLSISPAPIEWHLSGAGLAERASVEGKGKIKLTDEKEKLTIECNDTVGGTAGLGGAGEITEWTTSSCKDPLEKGLCETSGSSIVAMNLPWHTELATVEGVTRDIIVSGGKGTPGFEIKCDVLGVPATDKCTGAISLTTTNITAGVTAAFNASEKLNCSIGGSSQGAIEGSQTIKSISGGKLEAT